MWLRVTRVRFEAKNDWTEREYWKKEALRGDALRLNRVPNTAAGPAQLLHEHSLEPGVYGHVCKFATLRGEISDFWCCGYKCLVLFFSQSFVGRGSNVVTDVTSFGQNIHVTTKRNHLKRKYTNVCSKQPRDSAGFLFPPFLLHFTRFSFREDPFFVFRRDCFPATLETDF